MREGLEWGFLKLIPRAGIFQQKILYKRRDPIWLLQKLLHHTKWHTKSRKKLIYILHLSVWEGPFSVSLFYMRPTPRAYLSDTQSAFFIIIISTKCRVRLENYTFDVLLEIKAKWWLML